MRFKYKLLIYILSLNALVIAYGLFFYEVHSFHFLMIEAFVVVSLGIGIALFRQFSKPFDLLAAGVESLKDQDFSMKLKADKSKEFNQLIDVYNKMIDQLRNERVALSEKSFLLAKLMEASPAGIIIFDFDDCVSEMNRSAAKFVGHQLCDIKGKKISELSSLSGGMFDDIDGNDNYIFRRGGSSQIRIQNASFVDRGFETRFVLIEDLSADFFKLEKLSYEKVIRMMSHEVNNSVAAVNSMLQTIAPRIAEPRYADALNVCVERNANMNLFMRNFASVVKVPQAQMMLFDINGLLKRIIQLNLHNLGEKPIEVIDHLSSVPLMVTGDESHLEQVFINVFKNAVEAIEHVGYIELVSDYDSKVVSIRNNGVPITPDQREKLFTPFYSNKQKGQGIGLTLIREILAQHQCQFSLETVDGITSFEVVFS